MSKAVMISIKPKWVELIASGRETVEVRKTRPKIDVPFKCYIYCTKSDGWYGVQSKANPAKKTNEAGKVVGEFVCDKLFPIFSFSGSRFWLNETMVKETMLEKNEIIKYAGGAKEIYGWHISNLKMYDKPKELSKFCNGNSYLTIGENGKFTYTGMTRPPQSWGYVEELE